MCKQILYEQKTNLDQKTNLNQTEKLILTGVTTY